MHGASKAELIPAIPASPAIRFLIVESPLLQPCHGRLKRTKITGQTTELPFTCENMPLRERPFVNAYCC
jgi:hypothetical protein